MPLLWGSKRGTIILTTTHIGILYLGVIQGYIGFYRDYIGIDRDYIGVVSRGDVGIYRILWG